MFQVELHNNLVHVSMLNQTLCEEQLTQSLSFFPAGIPISSKVAGPVFFGGAGPEDTDGATEECLESPDCDDMAVVGRFEARLAF